MLRHLIGEKSLWVKLGSTPEMERRRAPMVVNTITEEAKDLPLPDDSRPPTISYLSPSGKKLAYFTVSEGSKKGELTNLVVIP